MPARGWQDKYQYGRDTIEIDCASLREIVGNS